MCYLAQIANDPQPICLVDHLVDPLLQFDLNKDKFY